MSGTRWLIGVLVLTLLAAACGRSNVVRRERGAGGHAYAAQQPIPASGAYLVRRGDTLYGIAFRHGLDYRDVARWNAIGSPYTIYPGQTIRLRPGSRVAAASPLRPPPGSRSTPPPGSRSTPPPGSRSTPPPRQSTPSRTPSSRTPPAPASRASAPVPTVVAGPLAWNWPTDGQVVGSYVAGDPTRQGLDIAGKSGQPVRTAADGVVVYSGAGLVGYGELVIVKHNDEWLSAYGHNRQRLVAEGEAVKSGQQIAELGHSGASRDMLHFEIRRNGKPVDPLPLLPAR